LLLTFALIFLLPFGDNHFSLLFLLFFKLLNIPLFLSFFFFLSSLNNQCIDFLILVLFRNFFISLLLSSAQFTCWPLISNFFFILHWIFSFPWTASFSLSFLARICSLSQLYWFSLIIRMLFLLQIIRPVLWKTCNSPWRFLFLILNPISVWEKIFIVKNCMSKFLYPCAFI
jgi:hypothetical protein